MENILITGANRGIGLAMSQHANALGHNVIGTGRQAEGLFDLEVTDPASHQKLVAGLNGAAIDILVCNAGVYTDKGKSIADYDPDDWHKSMAVNVMGPFLTVQALRENLKLAERPRVAIIASQMGSTARAPGGSYAYRASKAAAVNLARNLATDLAAEGIAVGAFHPGWVKTDMGGTEAEITVDTSAAGLLARFDALSLATSGCFEDWRGQSLAY